jgi:copper chaperone
MHRFKVAAMTCGHCAGTIEKAVKSADPRAEVSIDLRTKEVIVRSGLQEARIAEAIRSAGYESEKLSA